MPLFFVFSDRVGYDDLFRTDLLIGVGIQPDNPTVFEEWAASVGATADIRTFPTTSDIRIEALFSGFVDVIAITYQESARRLADFDPSFTFMDQDGNILSKELPADWVTIGSEGPDRFTETDEDQRLDGAGGEDRMSFHDAFEEYEVSFGAEGTLIVLKPNGTTAELTSIERVEFYGSGELVFDIVSDSAPAVYRLYGGAFDRTPDEEGLRYWIEAVDAGLSLRDAAAGFLQSPEFQRLYHYSDSGIPNGDFVRDIYFNVLGRSGEREGIDFWTEYLDSGGSQAEVLVQFTQLPEYVGLSEAYTLNGYLVA